MGEFLGLIRTGRANTRAELAETTGLARSAVAQRVEALVEAGLVNEMRAGVSTGGRPPVILEFNGKASVVLVADLGATHGHLAIVDLGNALLAEVNEQLDVASGPEVVLGWVQDTFEQLLVETGRSKEDVRGIGVGLPAPVKFLSGKAINPPIIPGWHGFPVREGFAERFPSVPVLMDNDVNLMALGEQRSRWPHVDHMLFVKIGTGIGCGIIADGQLHRGAQGVAGDIGHIRVGGHESVVCRCGSLGCLEAVASGGALARRLSELGIEARTSRDVIDHLLSGDPTAARLVRTSGELVGEVLAGVVSSFNPAVIVVGGQIVRADELLLAGIRTVVYNRSTPLATRHLEIAPSKLGERAGVVGAAQMVIDHILSPRAVEVAVVRSAGSGERA